MPYHMIGARNMESAVLGGYVDHLMQLHPGAPLPGVYLADEIFKNAIQHRERLSDEKFFEDLNRGKSAGGAWGKLTQGWDAARFEAALEAPPGSDEMSRAQGHASRPAPVASLRLLSIALCVDGAAVYDAVGCALTARRPLARNDPFRSPPPSVRLSRGMVQITSFAGNVSWGSCKVASRGAKDKKTPRASTPATPELLPPFEPCQ